MAGLAAFDIAALIMVGLCALRVAFGGFTREIAALSWLVLGGVAGFLFSGVVAQLFETWLGPGVFNQVLGFIAVFLLVFLIVKLLERSLLTVLEGLNLNSLDHALGFILGAVEGILLVFVLYFLLDIQQVWAIHEELAASHSAALFAPFLPYAQGLLPK